jgi:putative sterol carrier protein
MGANLTASRIERLRDIRGTLEFRLATSEGERRVEVRLGPTGEGSRCTLSMKAEDALRLQSGELRPEAAFVQGLVKLQGDITLAMQLGSVLFARR